MHREVTEEMTSGDVLRVVLNSKSEVPLRVSFRGPALGKDPFWEVGISREWHSEPVIIKMTGPEENRL